MNYFVFIFILLSSIGFFNPHGRIDMPYQKLLFYFSIMAGLVYTFFRGRSLREVNFPRMPYMILLVVLCINPFMSSLFHTQGFTASVGVTVQFIFGFLSLYVFMKLDLEESKVINIIIWLLGASTIVYFCNLATFPNNMFGAPIQSEDLSRGILRLPVVFIIFYPLVLLYCINQWLLDKRIKWVIIGIWMIIMIFMSVTRQVIFFSGMLALFMLLKNLSWIKKFALIGICAGLVALALPLIPAYTTMMELSEDQMEEGEDEENIRIQSWRWYTYENQTNAITPFLGNGVPSYGNSPWGIQCESLNTDTGRYAEDVGWAGFFWYFGLIATIALIMLLAGTMRANKNENGQYINYWIVFIFLSSIASAPILYFWQICAMMCVMSLPFGVRINATEPQSTEADAESEIAENDRHKSWMPKFPQLSK